jgi:hypothetical protein
MYYRLCDEPPDGSSGRSLLIATATMICSSSNSIAVQTSSVSEILVHIIQLVAYLEAAAAAPC